MSRQAGFTLIELLVAMSIGLVVLLAAFKALDTFSVANATITTRTDNTQRARLEMDGLVRALRSQACLGPGVPGLIAASATSVSFATDLGDGTTPPQKRTVTYDATARRLTEQRYAGITPATTPSTFSSTATRGPTLTGVDPGTGTAVFTYYAYDTTQSPPQPTLDLGTTVSAANLLRVARIKVSFRVGPAAGKVDRTTGAVLEDEVLVRSVDPSDPIPLPRCF